MLKFKKLSIRNFLSIGNVPQVINLDSKSLTVILGDNQDVVGDGARNGAGKSTIIQALHYCLYGQSIKNKIRKDNLINKTNTKNTEVSLEFEKDGHHYCIIRCRKPTSLKFIVDDQVVNEVDTNEAQGESKETQEAISEVIGISPQLFSHIILHLTPNIVEPFLASSANDQRLIIEELLGITALSQKAESLKELIKDSKLEIDKEKFKTQSVDDQNERIIKTISSLEEKEKQWDDNLLNSLLNFKDRVEKLENVDIEEELRLHRQKNQYKENKRELDSLSKEINAIERELEANIRDKRNLGLRSQQLKIDLVKTQQHACPTCGQEVHDKKHDEILVHIQKQLDEILVKEKEVDENIQDLTSALDELKSRYESKSSTLGEDVDTFYRTEQEAWEHKTTLEKTLEQIDSLGNETNPYTSQIVELKTNNIQENSYERLNDLMYILKHQEFLLKLLTSKDSFIRKRILDQNMQYLNHRLHYYLGKIGLPHQVAFLNDLSVLIRNKGEEYDYDNLSNGEKTRLILALCWSFRDVWERLNTPINLSFIDELLDSGLDTFAIEEAFGLLKKLNRDSGRSIFIISHREDLTNRATTVLNVIKENGFTTFHTSSIETE